MASVNGMREWLARLGRRLGRLTPTKGQLARGPRDDTARLQLDAGPAESAGLLRALALTTGLGSVLATGASLPGWVVGAAALLVAVWLPRGVAPAVWLVAIGVNLVQQGERPLWWFALSTALAVVGVHVTVASLRLTENLTWHSPVAVAVLRGRWPTFWRGQVTGQALGALAWALPALASAWFAVPGLLAAGVLAWLVLVPPRRRTGGSGSREADQVGGNPPTMVR